MKHIETKEEIKKGIHQLVAQYYRACHPSGEESYRPGDPVRYAAIEYDEEELGLLTEAMLEFWLTSGRFTARFEQVFAETMDIAYARLTGSGSSANLLAFMALTVPELKDRRILPGDEVITTACCFPTTVAPILQYGAVPVFIDITIPRYNADVSLLEEALSSRTKAVIFAHTMGNPFDIQRVTEFCRAHSLWLIEDNCDALGSTYTLQGRTAYTGTWGDIGTSSFYPAHHITTGEGGCVYTDNPELARIITSLRDWGRDCTCPPGRDDLCGARYAGTYGQLPPGYDHKYVYRYLGYNLKATDLQAAIGLGQLKKLPEFIRIRKENWTKLHRQLQDLQDVLILPEQEPEGDPSWFGYAITIRPGAPIDRQKMTAFLEHRNIQTRPMFSGNLVRQPCMAAYQEGVQYRIAGSLCCSDTVMRSSFWVGISPGMKMGMLEYVAQSIKEALSGV